MKIKIFIIIFGLLFISILSCGNTENAKKGFYATIRIVNADGSHGDTYNFEDPNALGSYGGFSGYLLYFSATQKSYQNPNNKDTIGFSYDAWDGGHNNLTDIPPGGLKLPISMQGGQVVFVFYFENYDNPPDSSEQMVASYESDSYLTIYSFEETGEMQRLLVGSVQCTLILKDGSQRIIEGDFSIPIEEIIG